jgi:hypothetical protein
MGNIFSKNHYVPNEEAITKMDGGESLLYANERRR